MWFPLFPGEDELAIAGATLTHQKQKAVFGEAYVDITPKLMLTAGLRYFDISDHSTFEQDGFIFGGFSSTSASGKTNGLNPKFSLSYKPNDDTLVYATAAKGFRAGGGNRPI